MVRCARPADVRRREKFGDEAPGILYDVVAALCDERYCRVKSTTQAFEPALFAPASEQLRGLGAVDPERGRRIVYPDQVAGPAEHRSEAAPLG
jgi:hypothetical protein